MMNDPALAGMMPYDLYEQPPKRYIFKMPRVVPDQKSKFESDELFRRLARESEVRYTNYKDRPQEERQIRFQNDCREGSIEISFVSSGTNILLVFNTNPIAKNPMYTLERVCDFDKEHGKVHIKSHFIMNGVCVRFKGYIDLLKLEGVGCLEFDEGRAAHEDAVLHQQIDMYKNRLREFEDKQRLYHGGQDDMEQVRRNVQGSIGVGVGGGGGMWRR